VNEQQILGLVSQWYRLRRLGLVPPLLQECVLMKRGTGLLREQWFFWTFDNPSDPWGSRKQISLDDLLQIVEQGAKHERKAVCTEVGNATRARLRRTGTES
jgi:hypothetical protein